MDEKEKEIGVKPIGKIRKLIGQIAIVLVGIGMLVWMLVLIAVKYARK